MRVSLRTANALRNVERDQWQTTYDRQHTGLGPANPNKLDNLQEKTTFYNTHGITDDAIVSTLPCATAKIKNFSSCCWHLGSLCTFAFVTREKKIVPALIVYDRSAF